MYTSIFFLLATLVPFFVFAAANTVMDLAKWLVTLMNMATALLITCAIVVFMWGSLYRMKGISKDSTELRNFMIWGVAVIFLIVSVWGLVELIKRSLLI
jgi:fumarate reductase subunit D